MKHVDLLIKFSWICVPYWRKTYDNASFFQPKNLLAIVTNCSTNSLTYHKRQFICSLNSNLHLTASIGKVLLVQLSPGCPHVFEILELKERSGEYIWIIKRSQMHVSRC